jgi:hypothetical protein
VKTISSRITLPLALAVSLLTVLPAAGASPEPCKVLPAEAWGSIMGYAATATPGDQNCTYQGKSGGGQFRILVVAASRAEAQAGAKRMRDQQPKESPNAGLGVVDSQGAVVFSISLFQDEVTDSTPAQLKKLVTVVRQHLPN